MDWLIPAAFLILIVLWLRLSRSLPGPAALPLIGHLHLLFLGPAPHVLFANLARKHGPVMFLKLGSVPLVVASTREAAQEFLKTHDRVFASRPPSTAQRFLMHDDVAFSPYGEKWRQLRRICTLELFTMKRVESFAQWRMEEVGSLLQSLASSTGVVDLRFQLQMLTFNFTSRVLMGKHYYSEGIEDKHEAKEFITVMDQILNLNGRFCIGDCLPFLGWLDLDGLQQKYKALAKVSDKVIQRIISEHELKTSNSRVPDFVDVLLKLRNAGEKCLEGPGIKAMLIDLFLGGSDTTAITLEWAMAELIKDPACMAKLQDEISTEVPGDRLVEESDIQNLTYLNAVVKETFRLHPIGVLLPAHYSLESCNVMGYDIPRGTTLIVNAHAIGRDPSIWKDPLQFKPERFVDSQLDVRGQHFELLPFGSGRRICPAISFALGLLHLTLANLVHAFDWKMAPGEMVDTINEQYGMNTCMKNKLKAIPHAKLVMLR